MSGVVIIGGGISGLSTAYHLAKAGIPSTLIERRGRLGGVIQTDVVEGCVVEAGPDSFPSAKPWALDLIRDLGLAGEVIGSNDHLRVTYIKRKGRLTPLPDGLMLMIPTKILPLVTTPLIGWATKIRMGLECFRVPTGKVREDRSVADFIRDHFNQEAVDYLTEPLLSGIYGGDPEQLSVSSVLAMFTEMERKYGSLTRGVLAARRRMRAQAGGEKAPLFQTMKHGLTSLTDALSKATAGHLTVIHDSALSVERSGAGFSIRLSSGAIDAGAVVLACQAYEAGALVRSIDPGLATLLETVGYNSSITVSLGYLKRDYDGFQSGFGFLIPKKERDRLMAGTWVGTKFSYRVPDDKVLLRCFLSGTFEGDDEALIRHIRGELREITGLSATPVFSHVNRWTRSMAQYPVGHPKRMEAMNARLAAIPGLYVAGNAYTGIGVSDCARMGKQAAERIMASRASRP